VVSIGIRICNRGVQRMPPRHVAKTMYAAVASLGTFLASPSVNAQQLSEDLHWYVNGKYNTTVDGNSLKGGKSLRPVSTFPYGDPSLYQFFVYKYHRPYRTDNKVASFDIEKFKLSGKTEKTAYRSTSAWSLPADGSWYYYYDARKKTGTRIDFSPYVWGSDTDVAIEASQADFHIGADVPIEGVAKVGAGAGYQNKTLKVKASVDPSVQLAIVFPRDESDTVDGGPLNTFRPVPYRSFGLSDWKNALANFTKPPLEGWDLKLSKNSLTDSDFLLGAPTTDLMVKLDPVHEGSSLPFEILGQITLPDGSLEYTNTPTLAFAVPESTSLSLVAIVFCATLFVRMRRQPNVNCVR
jgi:hypothetical protein